jgi:hypothetical protein
VSRADSNKSTGGSSPGSDRRHPKLSDRQFKEMCRQVREIQADVAAYLASQQQQSHPPAPMPEPPQ